MIDICPDQLLLNEYLAGKSSAQFHNDFESHLRKCRECQARLSQFKPTEDSLMRVLRDVVLAGAGASHQESQELSSALASIGSRAGHPGQPTNKDDAADGRVIRDYELKKKLGEGGMGAVYLALHTRLKKQVAVKLLKPDRNGYAGAIARFSVEMEAVGKLEHPNIVRALDAGEENGIHFLVMEYLPGIDLARLVRGLGPLSVADTCEIIRQAALGLHHAHENDIVHRDVKPSNLILSPTGKVKVLDLGLAHLRPALQDATGLTQENQVLGTLLYVAPEQFSASGKVDSRSDVYSLGVTLYELLLGRMPTRQGLVLAPTAEELAERPDVTPELWQLAGKMISLNRDDRPSSMLGVADSVRPYVMGANLANLLQQLMGQSTLEDPPASPQPSPTSGGGVSPSQWQAVYVEPPPLPSAYLLPPPVTVPAPQREGWLWKAAAALLTAVCLLLVVMLVINWNQKPTVPTLPASVPLAKGNVIVRIDGADGAMIEEMLDEGLVWAAPLSGGERIRLHSEENLLPVGKYIVEVSDADKNEADVAIDRKEFIVTADSTIKLPLRLSFDSDLLVPQLPEQPGVSSHGTGYLWYAGLGPRDEKTKLFFDLTLAVHWMGEAPQQRWLKVTMYDKQHRLTETAWLLVDWQEWESSHNLKYDPEQAWLQATSPEIERYLEMEFAESDQKVPKALVVPFSDQIDAIATEALKLGLVLPAERLTVHHALVLLFNATLPAAPGWVNKIRSNLPAEKRYSLEQVVVPGAGSWQGVIVTADTLPDDDAEAGERSAQQAAVGAELRLERSKSIPFSFGQILITSRLFEGMFKVTNFSRPDSAVVEIPPTAELSAAAASIQGLRRRVHPIYAVKLPHDGTSASYLGTLSWLAVDGRPAGELQHSFEIKMLGSEASGDRWIEVTTESGIKNKDHKETAILCIDSAAYEAGSFEIKQGWFIVGEDVFDFDAEGDIHQVEEDLYRLGKPLPAARFGVHDLLSLMFAAKMKGSRFGDVRDYFTNKRVLEDRVPEKKPSTFTLPQTRQEYRAITWSVAAKEDMSGGSYEIERSPLVPFAYCFAKITSPEKERTTFVAKLTQFSPEVQPAEPATKELRPEVKSRQLAAVAKTQKRVDQQKLEEPNLELWTLKSKAGMVRLFAEFAGSDKGTVWLRDKNNGNFTKWNRDENFPDAADQEVIDQGRLWFSTSDKLSFRGKLQAKSTVTDAWFEVTKGVKSAPRRIPLREFSELEREFIRRLMSPSR